MIPLKGRQIFHRFCRLSTKYDEKDAEKKYSDMLKKNTGRVQIGTIVYLCRNHGIDTEAVRLRLIEQRKALKQLTISSTSSTLGCISDDDDQEEEVVVVSKDTDPKTPLPTFGKLSLPYPLNIIYERGQTPPQCDAMLLTALTVMGAAMDWHVSTKYSDYFQYPCLQLFVMAPSASGKGAMARVQILEKIQAKGIIELRLSDDQMDDFDKHSLPTSRKGSWPLTGSLTAPSSARPSTPCVSCPSWLSSVSSRSMTEKG